MRKKLNNKRRKEDIIRLRKEGKSYNEIQSILGCSKSTIAYHCDGGKEKKRVLNQLKTRKPLCRKVSSFKSRCSKANYLTLRAKVKTFKRKNTRPGNRTNTYVNSISKNYTCDDVIKKIGNEPKCYLTGKPIDLNKPETYNLDHIIPTARGGTNDLSNLQICTKEANQAKGELSLDDLYELCNNIISWHEYNKKLS